MVTRPYLWAAALAGLWLADLGPASANPFHRAKPEAPAAAPGVAPDQQLAEAVARQLTLGGPLPGSAIDITCLAGRVDLDGTVADQSQADEAARRAHLVPGVLTITNRLTVGRVAPQPSAQPVQQAQALAPPPVGPVAPPPAGPVGPPMAGMVPPVLPVPGPGAYGLPPGAPASYDLQPPKLPSYAWPTYAPYNNYSRVAYPQLYPYNAWPFIGPFYPFPKVPLGWRSIKLEWEDGHWFYGKTASPHDYWRIRYW